jgi:hypothetical protein
MKMYYLFWQIQEYFVKPLNLLRNTYHLVNFIDRVQPFGVQLMIIGDQISQNQGQMMTVAATIHRLLEMTAKLSIVSRCYLMSVVSPSM